MIESIIVPIILQSAIPAALSPISDPLTDKLDPVRHHKRMSLHRTTKRDRLNLEPAVFKLFNKTTGFIDRLCCFSYANSQVSGEVAADYESEYEQQQQELLRSPAWSADSLEQESQHSASTTSKQQKHLPDQAVHGFIFLDGTKPSNGSLRLHTSGKPTPGSSNNTATTATMDSCQSTNSLNTLPTTRSSRSASSEDTSWQRKTTTPRQIQVPYSNKRRDRKKTTKSSIRKVQTESLSELPYLTMTEGYRC